jgi:hypothetical protein
MRSAIVAVAVAKDPAWVDNLHVDDARHVLAWADAIAERATHRLTLRRQAHGETDRESRGRYWRSSGHRRGYGALALSFGRARSARAAVEEQDLEATRALPSWDAGHRRLGPGNVGGCGATPGAGDVLSLAALVVENRGFRVFWWFGSRSGSPWSDVVPGVGSQVVFVS